ncbi:hypothetical protein BX600DRAFT_541669 [Xylariales sp. PMI_506]|nr:hypothetical protein BX600DRAFT_541669 [Xylariales sp. PMI_506]
MDAPSHGAILSPNPSYSLTLARAAGAHQSLLIRPFAPALNPELIWCKDKKARHDHTSKAWFSPSTGQVRASPKDAHHAAEPTPAQAACSPLPGWGDYESASVGGWVDCCARWGVDLIDDRHTLPRCFPVPATALALARVGAAAAAGACRRHGAAHGGIRPKCHTAMGGRNQITVGQIRKPFEFDGCDLVRFRDDSKLWKQRYNNAGRPRRDRGCIQVVPKYQVRALSLRGPFGAALAQVLGDLALGPCLRTAGFVLESASVACIRPWITAGYKGGT